MVSIHYFTYFTNPLKTGDIYALVQTVCTRPLLRGEGPGDEANTAIDYIYTVEHGSELQ